VPDVPDGPIDPIDPIGPIDPDAADPIDAAEPDAAEPDAAEPGAPSPLRSRRTVGWRAGAVVGVLIALLGFAIAVQVHANSQSDSLDNLSSEDLIGILDYQDARADRLREQIADLQKTLDQLHDSGDSDAAARRQAEQEVQDLEILLGTVPATGPGVDVVVTDTHHKLAAEVLLDVVEELRGAGAEAIQFGSVRVSTDTAFTEQGGAVAVDGTVLDPPYDVVAIGDPNTLDTALNIPGGVAATIRTDGGKLTVHEHTSVTITVTRPMPTPTYASPSGH
jgi:uncharacterized protein YlxW (UPF0749 family)